MCSEKAEVCAECGAHDPMGDEAAWHRDDCQAMRLPTRAVLKGRGRVRVLSYDGDNMFTVLTTRDVKVFVHRNRLTFTK